MKLWLASVASWLQGLLGLRKVESELREIITWDHYLWRSGPRDFSWFFLICTRLNALCSWRDGKERRSRVLSFLISYQTLVQPTYFSNTITWAYTSKAETPCCFVSILSLVLVRCYVMCGKLFQNTCDTKFLCLLHFLSWLNCTDLLKFGSTSLD